MREGLKELKGLAKWTSRERAHQTEETATQECTFEEYQEARVAGTVWWGREGIVVDGRRNKDM